MQQLREAIPTDHAYRFLMHDRDRIFSRQLDQQVCHLRLRVLKIQVRNPQANTLCERPLRTLRRECLDFLIPLTEHHLWCFLNEWVPHFNCPMLSCMTSRRKRPRTRVASAHTVPGLATSTA